MSKGSDEFAAAVGLLAAVAELEDPRLFPDVVLPRLAGTVRCDVVTYKEIDVATATVRWREYPPEALGHSSPLAFEAHPFIRYTQRSGEAASRPVSEFVTLQEFQRLGIYYESVRKVAAAHQITMTLHDPGKTVIRIAFNRSRRDFSDRERDIVRMLRRPLSASFERLRRRHEASNAWSASSASSAAGAGGGDPLTSREREVLELVAVGRTDDAIGHLLGCSRRTVGKHLEHAYRKLGVANRAAAVAQVRRPDGEFR